MSDTTNPAGAPPEEPVTSPQEVDSQLADTSTETEVEEGEEPVVDDTDEVEHEGQKYRVPKALKPAFMRHEDYTRKTQEVAEQRRQVEADVQRIVQTAQIQQRVFAEGREVLAIDHQIEQLRGIDLVALQQSNPDQAQQVFWRLQQLQGDRERKFSEVQQKAVQVQAEMERRDANRQREQEAILLREIPGWNRELAAKVREHALKDGYDPNELARVNALQVKTLYRAYLQDESAAKQRAAAKAAQPKSAEPTPIPVVRSTGTPVTGLSDKLGTEEWVRRRTAQLLKQKRG